MGNSDTKLNFRKAVIQLTTKSQVINLSCLHNHPSGVSGHTEPDDLVLTECKVINIIDSGLK